MIGASVRIKRLIGSTRAQYAFFARLDEEDALLRGQPICSNYERDGYVYLFNAEPGRYALVSAGYAVEASSGPAMTSVGGGFSVGPSVSMSNTINAYVPRKTMEETVVSVQGGEWAFLGDLVLEPSDWENADDVQRRYYGLLAPGHAEAGFMEKAFGGRHAPGTVLELDRDEASLARFVETSRRFAEEEWAEALRAPVGASPPER